MTVSSSRAPERLRARADEAAGVHVDDGERLGVVEDQVAAARAGRPGARASSGSRRRRRRPRRAASCPRAVAVDALGHVRRGLLQVALDALERLVVVDERLLEVAGEEVARDAQRQLGLLEEERRRLRGLRLRLDLLPELHQELEVELDVLGGGALGGGADDHAALLRGDRLDDVAAGGVRSSSSSRRETPRPFAARDVDDEAAGERDLGGQPRALRLHRVLDRLDEHLLAAADQVGDAAAARAAALELGADDLVHEQEAVLLEADLDERRLHPREHVVDDALVDVPGDRAALRAARGRPRRRGRPRGRRRASR